MAAAPATEPIAHRGIITVCAMVATLMQALDSTIANVALPYMQGSLATTSDQITWVLTSYVVAAAIMTSPIGWLSARFGRKILFIISLTGFTVASMLCGIAASLDQMVIFRLIQGVFGAALVPLSQATMLDIYPPEQRGQAMALWGMGVMVGPILGPTLGGYLTQNFNWRYVFFINLPIGILTVAGLWLFLKDTVRNTALQFDWTGFAVLSLAIGGLQMMLDRGEQKDWFSSTEIVIEAVLFGLGLYLFVVHMWLAKKPFIPPALFKDMNYLAGFFVMFAIGMVLLASSALLAPYLQSLGGYPVQTTGILMAPRGIGTMMAMMVAGRLTNKVDPRMVMFVGFLGIAGSMYLMTNWTPDVGPTSLAGTTFLQGFGLGLVFTPLQVVAFATLPGALRTDGAALISLIRNVGSAIGISVCSFMLEQNTQVVHAAIAEHVTPFNRMLQTGGAYLYWNSATAGGLAALNYEITRQAQAVAYLDDFKLMLIVSLPAILLLFMMRKPKVMPKPSADHAAVMD